MFIKGSEWFRFLVWVVLTAYSLDMICGQAVYAQTVPAQFYSQSMSPASSPVFFPLLKAISLDRHDPFKINFLIDEQSPAKLDEAQATTLIRYFLAFLTIPEKDLWVNLSPEEPDRIIDKDFGATFAGTAMLREDSLLKQLAASMTNPEQELGRKFWEEVSVKVRKEFGNVDIPLNSLNKVWVLPDTAVVYENEGAAYINESRLKVMLDADYRSLRSQMSRQAVGSGQEIASELCTRIMREVIVPAIEQEVNAGDRFVGLRQMYNALILAMWFKRHLQGGPFNQIYIDQKKTAGIETPDPGEVQRIYEQYLVVLKQGVYNLVREEYDSGTREMIPRKYFSGGFSFESVQKKIEYRPLSALRSDMAQKNGSISRLVFSLVPRGVSKGLILSMMAAAGTQVYPVDQGFADGRDLSLTGTARVSAVASDDGLSAEGRDMPAEAYAAESGQPGAYALSSRAIVAPEAVGLMVQTGGLVSDFDQGRRNYQPGDIIMTLLNPEVLQQRKELSARLQIEEESLEIDTKLAETGAVTLSHLAHAQERVFETRRLVALADLELAAGVVRAPVGLTIKEAFVSNGMTVGPGKQVLNYVTRQRVRLGLGVPSTLTYFGRISRFTIDGVPVQSVVSVDWQMDPGKTGAQVFFLVEPGVDIREGEEVLVEAEILPSPVLDSPLWAVKGKAQTLAKVRRPEEKVYMAPVRGPVKFHVKEGDRVVANQLLAEIDPHYYLEQYRNAVEAFNRVQAQLGALGPLQPGKRLVTREAEVELKRRRDALWATVLILHDQIFRLRIVAGENGVVTDRTALRSASFDRGSELLRVKTGRVLAGDINDAGAAILLPLGFDIKAGDSVLVETPGGERFAARVIAVNRSPLTQEMLLGAVQAVEVMVEDGKDALRDNLPLKIIVPGDEEKEAVEQVLAAGEHARAQVLGERKEVLARNDPRRLVTFAEQNNGDLPLDVPPMDGNGVSSTDTGYFSAGKVVYHDARSLEKQVGASLWVMMGGGEGVSGQGTRLDAAVEILLAEPNSIVRKKIMDLLTGELENDPQWLEAAEKIIMNSTNPDVVQRLLRFAVLRDGYNVRFLVNVIDRGIREDRPGLVREGFLILNDVLLQDPQVIVPLAGLASSSADGLPTGPRRSVDVVRDVLLKFLFWAPDSSIAKTRLLRSGYWTSDDLARIHISAKSAPDAGLQAFAGLVFDELLRREALGNMEEVFNPGPFARLSATIFDRDLRTVVLLREWQAANRRFLLISPRWREMERFILPALYERARRSAEALVHLNGGQGFTPVSLPEPVRELGTGLNYYLALNLEDQKRYINESRTVSELGRILRWHPALSGMALDRLMGTGPGRVAALEIYTGSDDIDLETLVERRHWSDVLREDIQAVEEPLTNDVYRRALLKMSERTSEPALLNVRLATFSLLDLHQAEDPRGSTVRDAEIRMAATRLALELMEQREIYQLRWSSGQTYHTPLQEALIDELQHRSGIMYDPQAFNAYVRQLKDREDAAIKDVVVDLEHQRDLFYKLITDVDQGVAKLPVLSTFFLGLFAGLVLLVVARGRLKAILRARADPGTLILELRREFSADSGNGSARSVLNVSSNDVVIIPDHGLDQETAGSLQAWRRIVSGWRHDQKGTPDQAQAVFSQVNALMNMAFDVFQRNAYGSDLMLRQGTREVRNEKTEDTLSYFNLLALDTLNVINDLLEKEAEYLDFYQKRKLWGDVKVLRRMMDYTTAFLRVLEYRGVIDRVVNYKFSDEHWAERTKIYPFMRWALLYSYQLRKSRRQIRKELPEVLRLGNELMPSLYVDPEGILRESESLLSVAITKALNLTSLGTRSTRHNNKMRSFLSRLRLFSVPFGLTVIGLLGVFGISGTMGLSLAGVLAVLISIGIFWVPHANIMKMTWSNTMHLAADKLLARIGEKLAGSLPPKKAAKAQEETVRSAVEDGMRVLRRELAAGNERSVDMVVMLSEDQSAGDIDSLRRYVDARRGVVFREDVPVQVLATTRQGSGNAYLEGVRLVSEQLSQGDFLRQYPQLRDVPLADLRVLFVLASSRDTHNDGVLDWAVINGYRAAVSVEGQRSEALLEDWHLPFGEDRGRHILIHSRDVYFGPVEGLSKGDIGLLANRMRESALKSHGLLNVETTEQGMLVREILEKLDIPGLLAQGKERVHPQKILQYLLRHFDLANPRLEQYPALTGVISLGPRVVSVVLDLLAQMQGRPDVAGGLRYLNFTHDLLNVIVKPEGDLARDYPEVRVEWEDVRDHYGSDEGGDVGNLFKGFYAMVSKAVKKYLPEGRLVRAAIPYPGEARLVHIAGVEDLVTFDSLLKYSSEEGSSELPWLAASVLSQGAERTADRSQAPEDHGMMEDRARRDLRAARELRRRVDAAMSLMAGQRDIVRMNAVAAAGIKAQIAVDKAAADMAQFERPEIGRERFLPAFGPAGSDRAPGEKPEVDYGGIDFTGSGKKIQVLSGVAKQASALLLPENAAIDLFSGFDYEILNIQPVQELFHVLFPRSLP